MRQNPSLAIIFPALCGNNFSFFARNTKLTIKAFFVNDFFLDSSAFVMSVRGDQASGDTFVFCNPWDSVRCVADDGWWRCQ